jgi:hypothetical protein
LLTELTTGNTLARPKTSNTTKKTSFLFMDKPLLGPTLRGGKASRDLR